MRLISRQSWNFKLRILKIIGPDDLMHLCIWRSERPKDAGVFCAGALSGMVVQSSWDFAVPSKRNRRLQMNCCRCLNHGHEDLHVIRMHKDIANHHERFAACFHARWRAWTQTWPGLQGWKTRKTLSCIESDHHCFMFSPQICGFFPVNSALGISIWIFWCPPASGNDGHAFL